MNNENPEEKILDTDTEVIYKGEHYKILIFVKSSKKYLLRGYGPEVERKELEVVIPKPGPES